MSYGIIIIIKISHYHTIDYQYFVYCYIITNYITVDITIYVYIYLYYN